MEMKKMLRGLMFLAVMLTVVMILGSAQAADVKKEPITLIMSHYQSTGSVSDGIINSWCENITKASDGLIRFNIYGGGSLGAPTNHYDMVRSGACDMAYSFYGIHPGVFKSFETFSLPMLGFLNAEHASKATWDFYENYDFAKKEKEQTHLVFVFSYPPSIIATNKFKIETAADLRGKSLRIMGGPINRFFTALGASSVTVPISDIYENLSKGIMNGYLGGVDSIIGYKLYECTTNLLSTPIAAGPFYMWMNLKKWESLPDWAKDIFNEHGGMNGAVYFGKGWDEYDARTVEEIKSHNMEINALSEAEYKNWEDIARDVTAEWIKELDDNGYDGKAIVDTIIALRDKYAPK